MRTKTVFFFLLAVSVLNAQDKPRAIDFTTALSTISGKPILQDPKDSKSIFTLGDAAVVALEGEIESDRGESGEQKFKRDQLARKIYGQSSIVLTVEEIALIKDRIGKVASPVVVGAAWPLLDPAVAPKGDTAKK